MPLNAVSQERLKILEQVVRQSYNSIMITSPSVDNPEILYVNPAFTKVTGYSLEEIKGKNPRILQGKLTDKEVILRLKKCIAKGDFFQGYTTNYRKDRTPYYVEWNITPIKNDLDEIIYFLSIQHDISSRIIQEKNLKLMVSMYQALFSKLPKTALQEIEKSSLFQKFKHLFVKPEETKTNVQNKPQLVIYDFILPDDLIQLKDINHDIGNIMDDVYIMGINTQNIKTLTVHISKFSHIVARYAEISKMNEYLFKLQDTLTNHAQNILDADEGIISILSSLFRELESWRETTFETGCISLEYMYPSFESDLNTFIAMLLNEGTQDENEIIFF
jgi:PAS domain S-box-containing protein